MHLGELTYLYVGVDDVERALAFYRDAFGGELVWRFRRFGTEVAAVRVSPVGPLVLLAEHRPTPSVLPIWSTADFDGAIARLAQAGYADDGETVGTPDGPVHVLRDPSGNTLGLLRPDQPGRLVGAFADPTNTGAVHDDT